MRKFMNVLLLALLVTGCAKQVEEITIRGEDGKDGISMAIAMEPTAPSCGLPGGVTIKTFVDLNNNQDLDINEPVKQTSIVCNGKDGINGTNATLTVGQATSTQCPTGGYTLTSSDSSVPVVICNGAKGDTGPQGLQGLQGPQGIAGLTAYDIWLASGKSGTEQDFLDSLIGQTGQTGATGAAGISAYQVWLNLGNTGSEAQFIAALKGPQGSAGSNGLDGSDGESAYDIWLSLGNVGTKAQFIASLKGPKGDTGLQGIQGPVGPNGGIGNITPVQLCPGDSGTYKEYGLFVGSSLFAVYHDNAAGNTFLALLKPGSYVTTNGSGCVFSYANNGTTATLSNGAGTTTVNLTSSNSGGGNTVTPLAGSCLVKKLQNYNAEQQFSFSVTGMSSYTSYTLEVTFGDSASITGFGNSNGGTNSYSAPTWTIAPMNSQTGFNFSVYHSQTVNVPVGSIAKVKQNGQEMTCTVQN